MRTVAQMTLALQRYAHDKAGQTYDATDLSQALSAGYDDLVDKLLADDTGQWALLAVSAAQDVADGDETAALPADCERLVEDGEQAGGHAVEWRLDEDEDWEALPRVEQPELYGSRRRSAVVESLLLTASTYGGRPYGWKPGDDGASIEFVPCDDVPSGLVRYRYLRRWAWADWDTSNPYPAGMDELVELLAADNLVLDQTEDGRRLGTYASKFASRFRSFCRGAGRGKFKPGQRRVLETRA